MNPKHNLNKDALQILLNGPYYLGLSFCVDSFFNSNQIGKVDRLVVIIYHNVIMMSYFIITSYDVIIASYYDATWFNRVCDNHIMTLHDVTSLHNI